MSMFMFLRVVYHGLILNAYNKTFVVEILSTIKIHFFIFYFFLSRVLFNFTNLFNLDRKKDFREPHGKIYNIHYFLFPTLGKMYLQATIFKCSMLAIFQIFITITCKSKKLSSDTL